MALTDQPYLPLYVDDWMNNNKLKMCSPSAHGLMVSIMCIMHKESDYGKILLRQKFKQNESKIKNFASQISKLSSFSLLEIEQPLNELIAENVLKINGDYLVCDRMVKDAGLSKTRAKAGRAARKKDEEFANDFAIAKKEANAGIVIENENVVEIENNKGGVGDFLEGDVSLMGFKGQARVWIESEKHYIWDKQDEFAIVSIEKKIKEVHRRGSMQMDKDAILETFKMTINNLPEWIKNNKFSLTYIDQKFNEIIHAIYNEPNSKKGSAPLSRQDEARLRALLESGALLGVD